MSKTIGVGLLLFHWLQGKIPQSFDKSIEESERC